MNWLLWLKDGLTSALMVTTKFIGPLMVCSSSLLHRKSKMYNLFKLLCIDRLSTGQNGFQGGASADSDWRPDWASVVSEWFSEYNFVTELRFDTG